MKKQKENVSGTLIPDTFISLSTVYCNGYYLFYGQGFLPIWGFSGLIMEIYPQLALGYYIAFLMYSELLFLYYFEDLKGSLINCLIFALVSIIGSILTANLSAIWYGLGFTISSFLHLPFPTLDFAGLKNIDSHVFAEDRF